MHDFFLFFLFSVVNAQDHAYSESYYQSGSTLVVSIIEPTYSSPVQDVKEGDFIYPLVHVEYNGTNVTDLNINNFTVNVGTESALINDVSYDGTTAYYTLNITIPTNPEGSKQDIWINVTYNGLWETDIIIEAVWYYSPTTTAPQPSPGPSPGPSPAPSPTPAPSPPRISNFTVDKDLIKIELRPREIKESIKVSNTGKTKLMITGKIQYLDELTFFSGTRTEHTFELDKNETVELEINFAAKKEQKPGVYPGKIVFTGDSLERTVLVVVEVESEKPLFDVKVEVLPEYRIVYPGDKVMAQLTLYNLGGIGKVDAELEYGVMSLDGTIITNEDGTVAIETQLSTIYGIELPASIKPGSYVFYSRISYNGVVGTGSSMFTVVEKLKFSMYLLIVIVLFIIIIILIIFFAIYNRKKKKLKSHKKKFKKFLRSNIK